jgi:hypothetical protein
LRLFCINCCILYGIGCLCYTIIQCCGTWNRNRRNQNFLPYGTGNGTVTCQKVVIGTVLKWYH